MDKEHTHDYDSCGICECGDYCRLYDDALDALEYIMGGN